MKATNTEPKMTTDGILKAIEAGAKSLTGVAKLLGYKSGSSAILKGIIKTVPDIESRLAANKMAKDTDASGAEPKAGKKAVTKIVEEKPSSTAAFPMPECVPFRPSSGYAMAWAILYAHKGTGISKPDLISKYKAWSQKPDRNCQFDVAVVISPNEDGSSHRSASKAAQSYWVERQNSFLTLHLVPDTKK